MTTNCYHTRDANKNSVKITGGMLHASSHDDAAMKAAHNLAVIIKPSGSPVFVDRQGREVSLYISVHPEHTEQGKAALRAFQEAEEKRLAEEYAEAAE
jgi:hypothetical protein